jgi:hypothetical protein
MMGFLKGLFGGKSDQRNADAHRPTPEPVCGHVTVIPRWDSAEDMGKTERVTVYHCEGCGTDFTPAELDAFRALYTHPA